jgi:CDP-glucose 4,6-dehydratase
VGLALPSGDWWRGKRVVVTGHTGFVGGWLSLWLTRLGAVVSGYALPATMPSFFAATGLKSRLHTSVEGDIRDLATLSEFMRRSKPEIVFHLAAQPIVRIAYEEPHATFATNVMGTVNVLEACRGLDSLTHLVVFTTDKVYENDQSAHPFGENERLGGREPYSGSKVGAEWATASYWDCYFRRQKTRPVVVTSRAGNIIGGGDWALSRIVPDAVRAFSDKRALVVRRPNARRPWQHVLDAVRGLLLLAERTSWFDRPGAQIGWNFGPPAAQAVSVATIADHAVRIWGDGASWRHEPDDGFSEGEILILSAAKAARELGWSCAWNIERTMEQAIRWYRGVHGGASALDLSERQIEEHVADVRASVT